MARCYMTPTPPCPPLLGVGLGPPDLERRGNEVAGGLVTTRERRDGGILPGRELVFGNRVVGVLVIRLTQLALALVRAIGLCVAIATLKDAAVRMGTLPDDDSRRGPWQRLPSRSMAYSTSTGTAQRGAPEVVRRSLPWWLTISRGSTGSG